MRSIDEIKMDFLKLVGNKIDQLQPATCTSNIGWKEKIKMTDQLLTSINGLFCEVILRDDKAISSGKVHELLQEMEPTINQLVITNMVD